MSRSLKKTPKSGITLATSEKDNKREANRNLRRKTKIQIQKEENSLLKLREVSDVWKFDKDGKLFLKKPSKNDLRK